MRMRSCNLIAQCWKAYFTSVVDSRLQQCFHYLCHASQPKVIGGPLDVSGDESPYHLGRCCLQSLVYTTSGHLRLHWEGNLFSGSLDLPICGRVPHNGAQGDAGSFFSWPPETEAEASSWSLHGLSCVTEWREGT